MKPLLNTLSPAALAAAMKGGTDEWGRSGSIYDPRYSEAVEPTSRRRCGCCKRRATHRGMANGIALMTGCELRVAQWVKDPMAAILRASKTNDR